MKFVENNQKLPWYEELLCWIGAILLIPLTVPLMLAGIVFGIAMAIFDKINDGFGH